MRPVLLSTDKTTASAPQEEPTRHGRAGMARNADLRVALQAGLWAALRKACRACAAMRLSCKDARDLADEHAEAAILRLQAGAQDTAQAAAAAGAYHGRLRSLHTLRVHYALPAEHETAAIQVMEAYADAFLAAAAGSPGIAACILDMRGTATLTAAAAAFSALLRALPQLRAFTLMGHSTALPDAAQLQVLQALRARYPGLQDLEFGCNYGKQYHHPSSLVAELCRFSALQRLVMPWDVLWQELQQLCAAMPQLACVGMRAIYYCNEELDDEADTLRAPRLTALTRPLASMQRAQQQPLPDWVPTYFVSLPPVAFVQWPALQQLHGWALRCYVGRERTEVAADDANLALLPAVVQRFAGCAHAWALYVRIGREGINVPSLQQRLAPGSLSGLRNLSLDFDDCVAEADAHAVLVCLLRAAPSISGMHLGIRNLDRLLATLAVVRQHAPALHTLWLPPSLLWLFTTDGEPPTSEALVDEVRALTQPSAAGGPACCALRLLLLQEPGEEELREAANAELAAQGSAVRVGSWSWGYS